jgi:hypothetical protein
MTRLLKVIRPIRQWCLRYFLRGHKPIGFLDEACQDYAAGWVWDPSMPLRRLLVDLYINDVFVCTAHADLFRRDLLEVGIGDGRHGFRAQWPASLRADSPAVIAARFHESRRELTGSPRTVRPLSKATRYLGSLDPIQDQYLRGWALNADIFLDRVTLEIVFDRTTKRRVVASGFRPDLVSGGIGDGQHAFQLELPSFLFDGHEHVIEATIVTTGEHITNSPMEFRSRYVGWIDSVQARRLIGFVYDAARPGATILVDVLIDGELVGTVAADAPVQGLEPSEVAGRHGFVFQLPPLLGPCSLAVKVHGGDMELSNSPIEIG